LTFATVGATKGGGWGLFGVGKEGTKDMLRLFARVRTFGVATALAIGSVGIVAQVPASASTSTNWQILVGPDLPRTYIGLNRFYPNDITVHPGDTVEFDWRGFHTATFNPPANLSLFDFGGFTGPPPGSSSLDTPTTFVNGAPPFGGPPPPFVVTIGSNLPAGSYKFSCRIHQFMHGVIRVTNGELPKTNAENQTLAAAQIAADTAQANKLDAKLKREAADNEGEATVGASGRVVELVNFFPSQISIRAGEELTFTDPDLHEPHTVSFGPIAGNPFDISFGVFPSGPGNPKAFDGISALNSGYLYHESQYDYWNIKVTAVSASVPRTEFGVTFTTPGQYNFYCAIHGGYDPATGQVFGMSGSITVLAKEKDDHNNG
jgi:plastocyanin